VTCACRNIKLMSEIIEGFVKEGIADAAERCHIILCDLTEFASIREFAKQ